MISVCENCKKSSDDAVGYCTCGGIRLIQSPMTDEIALAKLWPASPLVRTRIPGLQGIYLKYENGHLSGSFKDRVMRLAVRSALRSGAKGAVVPSSGNAALAAAAAGAGAGLPIFAIVPIGTAIERITPVTARGATVLQVGNDPSEAYRAADLIASHLGLARLYSTFAAPEAEWACRMIGIEAARQLESEEVAAVVAPISAGPVLIGTANGIAQERGKLPSIIAVQPKGCCPIAKAFSEEKAVVEPWTGVVETRATSIADRLHGYPQDGTYTLQLIRQTDGVADCVTDDEMGRARAALLQYDGIDAELSAAAGVAWLMQHPGAFSSRKAICVITASGYKQTYRGDVPGPAEHEDQDVGIEKVTNLLSTHGFDFAV